jgi:predicted O-methyltransferase YrrM
VAESPSDEPPELNSRGGVDWDVDPLTEQTRRFLEATAPAHDEIQAEMAAYADEHGFPIVGRTAGGVLRSVARLTDAERVFEFGSGYGYSASWFLRGMPGDGEIVLTEEDADELALGEEFLARAGYADRVTFEPGDAMETVHRYDGPFDVVLIDHLKALYADAFELVRQKVRPGGAVVADNVLRGGIDPEAVLTALEGGPLPEDDNSRGMVDYVRTVRDAPAFETVLLPVDEGLALSTRIE